MKSLTIESGLLLVLIATAAITGVVGLVTLAMTWWTCRKRRRQEVARDRIREQFLERLYRDDPEWNVWTDELSGTERRQLRRLLEEYLRRLRGTEYERLCTLARTLGIHVESKRKLDADRDRFRALTWLTLLEEPVEVDRLRDCCTDSQQHRAGAARLLFENDHPDAAEIGTELLIWDGNSPLSAFGMDTLYRLNNGPETAILSLVPDNIEVWDRRLLVQVLIVLRYCSVTESPERLAWLSELLGHESPQVRTAVVGVIERHGWRDPFQHQIDVETLLADPEPMVRSDVYQLLASWGSKQSAAWLRQGLDADDDRELLAVVRALSSHPRANLPQTEDLDPFVEWVQAEEAVGGRRERVWGVATAWN